jgi:hypothetical protein
MKKLIFLIPLVLLVSCATHRAASAPPAIIEQAQQIARQENVINNQREDLNTLLSRNTDMNTSISEALTLTAGLSATHEDLRRWADIWRPITQQMAFMLRINEALILDMIEEQESLISLILELQQILQENSLWLEE